MLDDLVISTSSEPETINDVIRAIGAELNRLTYGDISSDLQAIKLDLSNLQKANKTLAGLLVDSLTETHRLNGVYDIDTALKEIEEVSAEDIQELYKQALSGNRVFVGMGPEGSFMPQQEFDQIMRLQEPKEGRSLGKEFKPRTM